MKNLKWHSQFVRLGFLRVRSCVSRFIFFMILLTVAGLINAEAPVKSVDVKDRLNRIFYWQIADELKLSPQVEKQLSGMVEELQQRRHLALKKSQQSLTELKTLGGKSSKARVESLLRSYREALTELSRIDTEEFDRLKALLGVESLAKFYLVRDSVAEKVREALKHTESAPTGLVAPKK